MKLPLLTALLLAPLAMGHAATPDLAKVTSRADLDAVIASATDEHLKQALSDNAAAILAAAERYPHVAAVIHAIQTSPGAVTKINNTPEALKKAAGGDIAIFDTLTLVSTSTQNGKPHVYRKANEDPYDAGFIEHLGHISTLESVKIVATGIEDSWLPPLLKLTNLKSLSIEGGGKLGDPSLAQLRELTKLTGLASLELAYFGKATDTGLEQLAGLKNLESFTFRGSPVLGHAFARFEGWTKLKRINFHSNHLDDEGLGYVCEKFPNLEFIKLWHSKLITDASAEHIQKLKKLNGIEISCSKSTAGLVKNLRQLPLEYIALDYGVNTPAPDTIASVKAIPTLRRLSIGGQPLTDADLAMLASVTQLENVSFENLDLPDGRLPQLKAFAFLKNITFALRPKGYPLETQAQIKALLPKVDVKFVQ